MTLSYKNVVDCTLVFVAMELTNFGVILNDRMIYLNFNQSRKRLCVCVAISNSPVLLCWCASSRICSTTVSFG